MTADYLDLTPLDSIELASLATEFATICGVSYPQVAAWAARWYWVVTSEMADRSGTARESAPPIVTLADLPDAQLRFVRSFFQHELPVLADTLGAERLGDWCRCLGRHAAEAMGKRAREVAESADVLEDYIRAQRRARPTGTRSDTRDIEPWESASIRPDDGE